MFNLSSSSEKLLYDIMRGDLALIEKIRIHIERGSNVAIIGSQNSGKSTLLSLLAQFIPDNKTIFIKNNGFFYGKRLQEYYTNKNIVTEDVGYPQVFMLDEMISQRAELLFEQRYGKMRQVLMTVPVNSINELDRTLQSYAIKEKFPLNELKPTMGEVFQLVIRCVRDGNGNRYYLIEKES